MENMFSSIFFKNIVWKWVSFEGLLTIENNLRLTRFNLFTVFIFKPQEKNHVLHLVARFFQIKKMIWVPISKWWVPYDCFIFNQI